MSLLAYGQGMLAGEIGVGAGFTETWASTHPIYPRGEDGWADGGREAGGGGGGGGGGSSNIHGDGGDGFENSLGGHDFLSLLAAGAPDDEVPQPETSQPIRRVLHWDSPPQSPGAVFVHLPYSVLQIVATSTKADIVVVGVVQKNQVMEILLCVPRCMGLDLIEFSPDVLSAINGRVTHTEGLNLGKELTETLEGQPQAFIGHHFPLERYQGIFFALWRDSSCIPSTAEAIFADAVLSLPMLLSNRIEARKYERLGKRFDVILKLMPQAVVFVDDEMAQVVINPAAAELLELPSHGEVEPSRVAGAMKKFADSSGTRTDPQQWLKALTGTEDQEIEEEWELSAPRRVLHVRSYPVSSVSAHGRLWLYEDVTADRDACEAIQAANRAKSQFLAMMSHELRTPMTGVLGMLDLLHLTNLVPQQQEYLKIMQESAEGLMQVINNILDFCKMEASRLLLEEIDFSLGDLFDQVASLHEKRVAEKGLKMIIQGEAGANVAVRGDPVRLRQVIVNLVSNAIKFTETGSITVTWQYIPPPPMVDPAAVASNFQESSKILNRSLGGSAPLEAELHGTKPAALGNVSVESAAEISQGSTAKDKNIWLKVKVSDTGVGIAKEQLESLFTASQPGAPRRDASGTGLGLAICKGLLALMQGRMLPPESELGKGTTVTVILPLRPAEDSSKLLLEHPPDKPVTPQQQQQPNNNSSKEQETKPHVSVLVAEDNKVNQLLIRKIFRHYGHEVELVGNGKLAVEAVQKKNYDLVLMDLQMPVLDGLSATRAIRALPLPVSKVPIYALSADALAPESGPMEETGLDGYLSKPIVWEAMSVVVEKVLASKASW
ncbi:unnamed protein product [Sphagnum jensenii]|uniref:histidine kinase n=1 Tax=Sphagnum jensenii TaxID=128206 RepID=A0ABP1A9F4_9BRYO